MSGRVDEIVAAARRILEDEGWEEVTMRRLADALGIQAPSLYKHLPGKDAVKVALIRAGLEELGRCLHAALGDGADADAGDGPRPRPRPRPRPGSDEAIAAVLDAYRRESRAHPNLYRLATSGRLPRRELPPGLEEWAGEPFFAVTGDPHLAQALWSFAHGMVILELDGRYPAGSDLDRTWRAGAAAFSAACSRIIDGADRSLRPR